ncbi:MAG TPA: hypothetical protein VGG76_05720 [Gemmatimonadaceae bacterium]|jgi:hypothetical protein
MNKRYVVPSDYSPAETWRLVEWCRSNGADEFTVDCRSTDARTAKTLWQDFEEAVAQLAAGAAIRERMSGRTADDLNRKTELWKLSETSIDALKAAMPEGIFQYDSADGAWFEDLVLYRDGEMMLGVLSHEAFAILRLTDVEASELGAARFRSHESLPRIG